MCSQSDSNLEKILDNALKEFVDAQLGGGAVDVEEFVKQYPECESHLRSRIHDLQEINTLFGSLVETDESDFAQGEKLADLSGRTIGNFEIGEIIGRGGMGVVYLARDMKLDRSVAIKSMPAELQGDSIARMRFTLEAKLLASLNHPNIAVIHDIVEQEAGSGYMVLEYIAGQTLTEKIAGKALKLPEALSIGVQIAEALLAAYSQGITHRDLKPDNIKITPDGRVKVLDFGLAKAAVSQDENPDIIITQTGHIVGTPAYMSPEQARGSLIDHRSDIWSFGCVLYEMVTGLRPFDGETVSDTIACVLQRDANLDCLPASTPANIKVLIRRCLEKKPLQRLQHIGDAIIEINETINMPAAAGPYFAPTASAPTGRPRHVLTAALFSLLLLSVVVCLVLWKRGPGTSPPHGPVRSYVIHPKTSLAMTALWHHALAFSPDGTRLAYVEQGEDRRRRIYLRLMDQVNPMPLAGTEGAVSPFFSPSGKWIGYVDHFHKQLKKVSSKGGNPMVLTLCSEFRGGTWAQDGTIIFCPEVKGGLWRISTSSEGLKQLTAPDETKDEHGHWWPCILPDGKTVIFTNARTAKLDEYQIETYSLETGQRRILFKGGHYARYISTGHLLYARRENLYAVGFDLGRLETTGDHVQIKSDVISQNSRSSQFACSNDGSLAYIPVVARSTELKPLWVDSQGMTQPFGITARDYHSVRISPDGKRVAFSIKEGDNQDIWIYDLEHRTLSPLTSNGKSLWPVWLADSKRLAFSFSGRVFRQHADGGTEPVPISAENAGSPQSCSPDGKELLVSMGYDIGVLSLEGPESNSPTPLIQRNHDQRLAAWSPDGKWIAYNSEETGSSEVYVEPYPGPGPRTTISTQGGIQPVWAKDGKELYYRSGDKIMGVSLDTESEFKIIDAKVLFEGNFLYCLNCQTYDVAADGRFLMIQGPLEPAPARINVILNWTEQLKRLVPAGGK